MPKKPNLQGERLTNMHLVGDKIRLCRLQRRLSQTEFASMVGVTSPAIISHWETGANLPSIKNLAKISEAMDIPITDLLGEELKSKNRVSSGSKNSEAVPAYR